MNDEHKEPNPTHNEAFFRQPRYQIECKSFELLNLIPTYRQEKKQPVYADDSSNTSNCMIFDELSIKMNNNNNNTINQ